VQTQLEVDARYAAYVDRQSADVAALKRDEQVRIPANLDFRAIPGLSNEIRQKLERQRPGSLAQAAGIDGMTPAALLLLRAHAKRAAVRIAS
jgi:tRNA uridine 5-carboxymethylaminomethyl modification enzyme